MDANRNIIPVVEDDQGEGFMDPLDIDEIIRMKKEKTGVFGLNHFQKLVVKASKAQMKKVPRSKNVKWRHGHR